MTPQPPSSATADEPERRLDPNGSIVVGIDGSSEARRGLLFAADLAQALGVELIVIHAYGLIGSFGEWRSGVQERERQVNTVMVDEWCAPLADCVGDPTAPATARHRSSAVPGRTSCVTATVL